MTRITLSGLAAAALLALALAGCAGPAADTTTADGSSDDSSASTDDGTSAGDGSLVTLAGSGDYTVGVTAPIGGYSLKGDPDSQPDGCTWALEDANGETQFQDQGPTVFITDQNKYFQTSGCPDWVQFE